MKNLVRSLFALIILAGIGLLYNCSDDGGEETFDIPSITITSTDFVQDTASVQPGEDVTFTAVVDAPGNLDHVTATVFVNNVSVWDSTYTRGAGETVTDFTFGPFTFTAESEWVGEDVEIEIEALDNESQTGTKILVIEVTSPDARIYSAFLLAAPLANDPGTPGDDRTSLTWFSTNLGERITSADVVSGASSSADVDFGYYGLTEATDGFALASPSAYPSTVYNLGAGGQNWGTINATTLKSTTLNASAFAEIVTFADIDEAFDAGTDPTGSKTNLEVGDVIAFETDADKVGGSKRGLILVTDVVDDNGDGEFFDLGDGIEIEVIVQESAE